MCTKMPNELWSIWNYFSFEMAAIFVFFIETLDELIEGDTYHIICHVNEISAWLINCPLPPDG